MLVAGQIAGRDEVAAVETGVGEGGGGVAVEFAVLAETGAGFGDIARSGLEFVGGPERGAQLSVEADGVVDTAGEMARAGGQAEAVRLGLEGLDRYEEEKNRSHIL